MDAWTYESAAHLLPDPSGMVIPALSSATWFIIFLVIFTLVRLLQVFSYPEVPKVFVSTGDGDRMCKVVEMCPTLRGVYRPPRLWGRNGHLQTAFYGVLGHAALRRQFDRRHAILIADGSTVTFDVFEPVKEHSTGRDYTLALCPGIANSSESNYIRTCVHLAQEKGFRIAVLNHIGAARNIEVTGERIFGYGCTDELEAMMVRLAELYPSTKFVCVGFSMGANLTTLLMSRAPPKLRARILAGLSVCQGYDVQKASKIYHEWEGGRRFYNYVLSENIKRLLRRHYDKVVACHVRRGLVNEQRLWASTSIYTVDDYYNKQIFGYDSVDRYYRDVSSIHVIPKIDIPMIYLNALDDPLIPPMLWMPLKELIAAKPDTCFIVTKHGGHLGFLEGHSLAPRSVTWLDRFIVQMASAAIHVYDKV